MAEHLNEQFLEALAYCDKTMREDKANGKPWKYTNRKKRYSRFEEARSHNRYTNCVSGVQFGLLQIGLPGATCHWYGAGGNIVYTTAKGKEAVKKYFDIIEANDTVSNLYNGQKLCDGDIIIFANMNHTCAYYGGGKSFDSGHAYCNQSGELAVFNKWIGNLTYKTSKVAWILRFKDRAHYRIQCGAFSSQGLEYQEMLTKLNNAGYKTMLVQEGGMFKIQIGYFSGKTNAENYAAKVAKKGFPVIVVEASNAQAIEVKPDSTTPSPTPITPTPIPTPAPTPAPTPTKQTVYRVQVGVFKTTDARNKLANDIKEKTGFDTFYEEQDDQYYLFCGSFATKAKAEERVQLLSKKKIGCLIKEFQV